jgi:hypothetical protein
MTIQWKDELEAKFGLSFDIIDRERIGEMRRLRGFSVNPSLASEKPCNLFADVKLQSQACASRPSANGRPVRLRDLQATTDQL